MKLITDAEIEELETNKALAQSTPTTSHLRPFDQWQQAYRNGGLPTLLYGCMSAYQGPLHQEYCEEIITEALQIAAEPLASLALITRLRAAEEALAYYASLNNFGIDVRAKAHFARVKGDT